MRKYLAPIVTLAFLLFTVVLVAQTTGNSGSYPPSGTNSSQNPNSPAGDQTQPSVGAPSGSTMGSNPTEGTAKEGDNDTQGKTRTVEGCVVREQTDYFLIPKSGNPIRLSASGTDIGEHSGHRIKAHGTETSASAAGGSASAGTGGISGSANSGNAGAAGTSGTAGTTGAMGSNTGASAGVGTSGATGSVGANSGTGTGSSQGTMTGETGSTAGSTGSAAGSTGSTAGSTGSTAGSTGSTAGSTGSNAGSTGNQLHQSADKEMLVDKVTMVSESCPSDWNPSYSTSSGNNSGTSNPPKY